MGRPKGSKTKPAKAAPAAETAKTISKAEAVRQALAEGLQSPGDISEFAKAKYGLAIPKMMASASKSQLKKRDLEHRIAGKKERPKTATAKTASTAKLDMIGALEALKPLVKQMGAEDVKRLIDILD
jgi:hypothetical protein